MELRTAIVKLDSERTLSVLSEGDMMASCEDPEGVGCDAYGLYFAPDQKSYIYAFQEDAEGTITNLFPNPNYSEESNPVPAGATLWVPKDFGSWFALDDIVGEETIFLVVASEPIDVLEGMVQSGTGYGAEANEAKAQLTAWLIDRGAPDVINQNVSVPLPDGERKDLETLVLSSTGEEAFVHQVKFQHVPPGSLQ